jgi:antitoxin HigA-1
MSGSRTIIADGDDRLPNVHPGDILRDDFLIGSAIPVEEVAGGSGLEIARLLALLDGRAAVDAETDLRLARYFGMSEGFFLGLQHDFDLEDARDRHRDALARIVRRAA